MKFVLYLIPVIFFVSCSFQSEVNVKNIPKKTKIVESSFSELPSWSKENHKEVLKLFIKDCTTKKAQKIYLSLCKKAKDVADAKSFFEDNFSVYKIEPSSSNSILTGYYEPLLYGSLTKHFKYKYPIYNVPKDLVSVDLKSIYPELSSYRLRGRVVGNKLIPYYKRGEKESLDADVICWVDSKIDKFFLEIQGSGRVELDNNETIFIGYANQNGYKYRAIGRYLVKIGALSKNEVSLQTIKQWLLKHPKRVDEVLNYNKSLVFFEKRKNSATGALGLALDAKRSVAVDRRYIPYASMLYIKSDSDVLDINRVVFAQDTGGAIRGSVRADLFLGYGKNAQNIAGKLNAKLEMWVILPKGI